MSADPADITTWLEAAATTPGLPPRPVEPYDGPTPDNTLSPSDEAYYAAVAEDRETRWREGR